MKALLLYLLGRLSCVKQALPLVKDAAAKALENDEKRAWVLSRLAALGLSESVARFAIECALRILKNEIPA